MLRKLREPSKLNMELHQTTKQSCNVETDWTSSQVWTWWSQVRQVLTIKPKKHGSVLIYNLTSPPLNKLPECCYIAQYTVMSKQCSRHFKNDQKTRKQKFKIIIILIIIIPSLTWEFNWFSQESIIFSQQGFKSVRIYHSNLNMLFFFTLFQIPQPWLYRTF